MVHTRASCDCLLLNDYDFIVDLKVRLRHVLPKLRNIAALTIKNLLRMRRMPGYVAATGSQPICRHF